jgi:uncharacterized protein (DUF58 family)
MKLWKDQHLSLSITRLGLEYLAALVLMGGFAVNSGNNLLYLVFSLMLGLFLVSGWVSRRAIRDLEPAAIEEGHLFARIQGGIRIRLRERGRRRPRGLEVRLDLEHVRVEPGFYAGTHGAGREPVLVLQAWPDRRGPCRARRLELRTAFPFGFLEKAWGFPLEQELLVLPHPRAFAPRPGGEGTLPQHRAWPGNSGPDGSRPYRERDPLSRMHWKRTAQRGTPWVRTFEDDPPAGLRLRLDLRAWEAGPEFEKELEFLSGGVLRARLQRREVRLRVEGGADGDREYAGSAACWRALALAEPARRTLRPG